MRKQLCKLLLMINQLDSINRCLIYSNEAFSLMSRMHQQLSNDLIAQTILRQNLVCERIKGILESSVLIQGGQVLCRNKIFRQMEYQTSKLKIKGVTPYQI